MNLMEFSGSAQISTDISGSFVAPSASFSVNDRRNRIRKYLIIKFSSNS